VGALIVIGTYTVNEVIVNRIVESNERIASAQRDIGVRAEEKWVDETLMDIQQMLKDKNSTLKNQATTANDAQKTVVELTGAGDKFGKVTRLLALLPRNEEVENLNRQQFKLEERFTSVSQMAFSHFELYPYELNKHFQQIFGSVTTEDVQAANLRLEKDAERFEVSVRRAALQSLEEDESRIGAYKALSLLLYLMGWTLNLGSKLFGPTSLEAGQ